MDRSSTISTDEMLQIIEKLKCNAHKSSTMKNYHSIWKEFNKFVIRLDWKPKFWEDKVALFCGYLTEKGRQSSTIKSYISGIKFILKQDGYQWDDNRIAFSAFTNACRLSNDIFKTRLPISFKLLELLLFELDRFFPTQFYLNILYKTIFSFAYYGMMRIGELAHSEHQIWASNVHIAQNKRKIMIILLSSKTHGKGSKPQKISIVGDNESIYYNHFCPFNLVKVYCKIRGNISKVNEPFFVFKDGSDIFPSNVRTVLRQLLDNMNLESSLYDTHSFRIGRSVDLFSANIPLSRIKLAGRWKSNVVYKYITQ